jgi:hypothetical protein
VDFSSLQGWWALRISSGELRARYWKIKLSAANFADALPKCADWRPLNSSNDLIATGLESGKILLLQASLGHEISVVDEIFPKTIRQCTAVAFCPNDPTLLAATFDVQSHAPALYVWHIDYGPESEAIAVVPSSSSVSSTSSSSLALSSASQMTTTMISEDGGKIRGRRAGGTSKSSLRSSTSFRKI